MVYGLTDEIFSVFGERMGLLEELSFREVYFEFRVERKEYLIEGEDLDFSLFLRRLEPVRYSS